jgi:hypothetical protein
LPSSNEWGAGAERDVSPKVIDSQVIEIDFLILVLWFYLKSTSNKYLWNQEEPRRVLINYATKDISWKNWEVSKS